MHSVTQDQLIRGIKSGDESAFRELVETFQKQVFNTCNAIVHNPHDADDLSQEVFIEVFRSAGSFRGDSKLSTWFYRIAVNKALNHVRQMKRRNWLQSLEDFFTTKNPQNLADEFSLPSEGIESSQRSSHLHQAINSLAENQRTAFLLSKYEELSYLQVAEVMQTTVPAVESLIHRAKINLQKKLFNAYKKNEL